MTCHSRHARLATSLRIAALGALLFGSPLRAQDSGRATFVTIPLEFPQIDARAIVIRERGRDVIVLRSTEATHEALAMALSVLERARQRDPVPTAGEMIPITGFAFTADLDRRDRVRLGRVLDRLAGRPVADLGSLGEGRWLRFGAR